MADEKVSKTFRLDKGLIKKLEKRAKNENRSLGNLVETLLLKAVK